MTSIANRTTGKHKEPRIVTLWASISAWVQWLKHMVVAAKGFGLGAIGIVVAFVGLVAIAAGYPAGGVLLVLALIPGVPGVYYAIKGLNAGRRIFAKVHGAARFSTRAEAGARGMFDVQPNYPPYLGQFWEANQAWEPLFYGGDGNVISFGPPGSGKGMRVFVPNIAHMRNKSLFIIDPKGQAAAMTARWRAQLGQVRIVNPYNVLVDTHPYLRSQGWNPLARIRHDTPYFVSDMSNLADAMVEVSGAGTGTTNDTHWKESSKDFLTAMGMAEVLSEVRKLGNVRQIVTLPYGKDDELEAILQTSGLLTHLLKVYDLFQGTPLGNKVARYLLDTNEIKSIISSAVTATKFLDDELICADLELGSGWDWQEAKTHCGVGTEGVTTYYVILPAKELINQAPWMRMIVQCALRELMGTPRNEIDVVFMLDEAALLGFLPSVANAMSQARDMGIKMWPIYHDLAQLKKIFGEGWRAIFACKGAMSSFAVEDWESAEYHAKHGGTSTELVETRNQLLHQAAQQGMGGGSHVPTGVPLIRGEELMALEEGFQFVRARPLPHPCVTYAPMVHHTPWGRVCDPNPYRPRNRQPRRRQHA